LTKIARKSRPDSDSDGQVP